MHRARRILHFNVTQYSSAEWTLQQLREALGHGDFRYLIHDRDSIFARRLDESIKNLGMTVLKSPPQSRRAVHARATSHCRNRLDLGRYGYR